MVSVTSKPVSHWLRICYDPSVTFQEQNSSLYSSGILTESLWRNALRLLGIGALVTTSFVISVPGATLETVAPLSQSLPGGTAPAFPQVRLANGTFYGTVYGGFNGNPDRGSVYKLTPTGSFTSLYQFHASTQDEANPTILIAGSDGNLYGATAPQAVGDLNGMIFKLTPAGAFTPLYRFQDAKGTHVTSLIQGRDGNFYGTAAGDSSGGFFNHPPEMHDAGVLFKLTPTGVFTALYSFTGGPDGSFPDATVQGQDGNFYGSAENGPELPANTFSGFGNIFKVTPGGAQTVLYSFTGGNDGGNPGKLTQGGDGNLYGITGYPAISAIFKTTLAGTRNTVFRFEGSYGTTPSQLTASSDGNVYGTTQDGGIPQQGIVFAITPAGQVTTYSFDGTSTGGRPSQLFEGESHNLYGVTAIGGPSGFGTIFRLNMAPPRNLLNISTRLRVLTDDKVLIGGFIIAGTDAKRVIIRGIGPSLTGVGSTLQDPILELHQGAATIAYNDDWRANQAEVEATGLAPTNDLESAIVTTLNPGPYTAILKGKDNGTGIGIVEVYDLNQTANSRLANISTRGFVDTGSNVMIGGLIISGGTDGGIARVIVRAIGPSLVSSGIQGPLPDPELELHDSNGATIVVNDNWKLRQDGTSQQAEIEATGIPPTNDLESAVVQSLAPGNYTVVIQGTNNTTGIAVVEAYTLQ